MVGPTQNVVKPREDNWQTTQHCSSYLVWQDLAWLGLAQCGPFYGKCSVRDVHIQHSTAGNECLDVVQCLQTGWCVAGFGLLPQKSRICVKDKNTTIDQVCLAKFGPCRICQHLPSKVRKKSKVKQYIWHKRGLTEFRFIARFGAVWLCSTCCETAGTTICKLRCLVRFRCGMFVLDRVGVGGNSKTPYFKFQRSRPWFMFWPSMLWQYICRTSPKSTTSTWGRVVNCRARALWRCCSSGFCVRLGTECLARIRFVCHSCVNWRLLSDASKVVEYIQLRQRSHPQHHKPPTDNDVDSLSSHSPPPPAPNTCRTTTTPLLPASVGVVRSCWWANDRGWLAVPATSGPSHPHTITPAPSPPPQKVRDTVVAEGSILWPHGWRITPAKRDKMLLRALQRAVWNGFPCVEPLRNRSCSSCLLPMIWGWTSVLGFFVFVHLFKVVCPRLAGGFVRCSWATSANQVVTNLVEAFLGSCLILVAVWLGPRDWCEVSGACGAWYQFYVVQ